MTLLRPLFQRVGAANDFGTNGAPTPLTPRNDVILNTDLLIGALYSTLPDGAYMRSYEEMAQKQLWVRIALNKLAYVIGRLPLKTYERTGDGRRERRPDSPLAQLLAAPNETKETGHPAGFQARVVHDLMTYANAMIVKEQTRPDATPIGLRPVSLRGWSILESGEYVWKSPFDPRNEKRYKPWQIIHIIEPGPTANGFGVSRLEAARLTLAIEYAAQRLGVATFQNGARPGGIINVKSGLPTNDQARAAAIERFKDEVKRRFGGVDKAGLPAVLEGDVAWQAMSHNLDDSAVVAHRQLTRMEVAALFDIPQPAIGILDEANFASVDILHVMLYQDTLGWPINLIESALDAQLVRGVPAFAGHFAEFDLNAVMRGAFLQRMQGYQIAINSRVMTPQEARDRENLADMTEEQPDAGLLQFPLNYTVSPEPAGQGQGGPQPPAASAVRANGHGAAHA